MKSTGPINVVFAASASAVTLGGLAVLFVPALAFFYLVGANRPVNGATEYGMILAVVTPFCCAAARDPRAVTGTVWRHIPDSSRGRPRRHPPRGVKAWFTV